MTTPLTSRFRGIGFIESHLMTILLILRWINLDENKLTQTFSKKNYSIKVEKKNRFHSIKFWVPPQ